MGPCASAPPRTPSYRHHKPSGLAILTLAGRDVYLGRYDTPERRAEYDRIIAEWLIGGRRPTPAASGPDLTVNEVLLAYVQHAESYYLKGGEPTSEVRNIKLSLRPVRQLYGHTGAVNFGPLALKAVRQAMIDSGLCRNEVNKGLKKANRPAPRRGSPRTISPGRPGG